MNDGSEGATVLELVSINQARAQAMLMGSSFGGPAPALLSTWHQVVESAADLWSGLPPTEAPAQLLMERLTGLSTSLHDALRRAPWPATAEPDRELRLLAVTFSQAADLLHAGRGQLSRDEADQVRAAVAATLQLGAHAVRIVANHYVTEAATLTKSRSRRHHRPRSTLVADSADRLIGFEQLAGAAAGGLYESRRPTADSEADHELAATLAEWQVQSHRSLARHPTAANLFIIAHTQARIGKLASAAFHSTAVTGNADLDELLTRLLPPLTDATEGWRDLTTEWHAMLAGDAYQQLDPDLCRASDRVRAIIGQLIGRQFGNVNPDYALAFALDVRQATPVMQDALAHSADIARTIRDAATAAELAIRGPARHLANRAATLAGNDVAWVDLRALNRGRLITLPRPVREQIGAACNNIAADSNRALAASALLDRHPPATATIRVVAPECTPRVRHQPYASTRPSPLPHPAR